MFNRHDISADACALTGPLASNGYDRWWHSFTGYEENTGRPLSFFVEYYLCNPLDGSAKPVFAHTRGGKLSKQKPSYLMIKAGCWGEERMQLHRFYGAHRIGVDYGVPVSICAGDCFLGEDGIRGNISVSKDEASQNKDWMSDAGTMSWSLVMDKQVAFNPGPGYFLHAEGMKTAYTGDVVVNGVRYIVRPENSHGFAGKNWGSDLPSRSIRLSSCNLSDIATGKKLSGNVFNTSLAPNGKLLSAFWIDGREYEFNLSGLSRLCKTKTSCREAGRTIIWHIEQKSLFDKVILDVTCRKKDMILARYESPTGERRTRRLWNGGNGSGKVQIFHKGKNIYTFKAENVLCELGI